MSTNISWSERLKNAVPSGIGIGNNIFVHHAKNAQLWDIDGNRYIDFTGGIGVVNTGHCNENVINAAKAQIEKFTHTCFQVVPYTIYVELAEKLNVLTPGNFPKKTMLLSAGAEAVENSIKIARMATRRTGVIAFSGAFHGRTLFAAGLTGKVNPYKQGLGLVSRDIFHVPFPAIGSSLEKTKQSIEDLFKSDIEVSNIAAVIFEPVQGEGGFYQIQKEALLWIRELCDKHGIVMIADEIQSGFARTGRMFAMEHYGVIPDMIISAKSLAGGFTLAAVTGRSGIMDGPVRGALGGTYVGNPVAIAAALAVIEVMERENLPLKAEKIGQAIEMKVQPLLTKITGIKEFRRLGAMAAIEFIDPETKEPSALLAQKVQQAAFSNGLLLLTCGHYGNIIRFLSPLTIEESVLAEGLDILENALMSLK